MIWILLIASILYGTQSLVDHQTWPANSNYPDIFWLKATVSPRNLSGLNWVNKITFNIPRILLPPTIQAIKASLDQWWNITQTNTSKLKPSHGWNGGKRSVWRNNETMEPFPFPRKTDHSRKISRLLVDPWLTCLKGQWTFKSNIAANYSGIWCHQNRDSLNCSQAGKNNIAKEIGCWAFWKK